MYALCMYVSMRCQLLQVRVIVMLNRVKNVGGKSIRIVFNRIIQRAFKTIVLIMKTFLKYLSLPQ